MTKFSQRSFSVFVTDHSGTRRSKLHCPRCGTEGIRLPHTEAFDKLVCLKRGCTATWYNRRRAT